MQKLDSTLRLKALREEMQKQQLDAYVVPMEDCHFTEYLAAADKRIAYISGFTGSAGSIVVTSGDKAALWTDGRYHTQANVELDDNWILMREGLADVPTMPEWISSVTPKNARIGFDPQQLPFHSVLLMQRDLDSTCTDMTAHRCLEPIEGGSNLIDIIWKGRPNRPTDPIRSVDVASFAGQTWEEKVDALREKMKEKGATSLVIFALDEIAWLLNLRGSDISCNPVFFSFAVVGMEDIHLFVDTERGPDSIAFKDYFKSASHTVTLYPYSGFSAWLHSNPDWGKGHVWLPAVSSHAIVNAVPARQRLFEISPVSTLKAVKNAQEVEGMREANLVDSLALSHYLAWLDETMAMVGQGLDPTGVVPPCDVPGVKPPKKLTEASCGTYLDKIRRAAKGCLGLSFATISSADANGAVIHYHAGEKTDSLPITPDTLYLVDSGGQYTTGTTDVTRTMHMGKPTKEQIADYTQVLKAHARLALLTFPENTQGTKLDAICRASMWRTQRDFGHGVGHGVGANLCVHEGPIGLSGRRTQAFARMGIVEPGLRKNMIVTIEPGYYLPGKYGIRLENVTLIVEAPTPGPSSTPFLAFEPFTLVPFQRRLIDPTALSDEEVAWINFYHVTVREKLLAALVEEQKGEELSPGRQHTKDWIIRETERL